MLVVVDLVVAALALVVVLRWRAARRAVTPMGVDVRIRARPPDEEQVDAWVERALREVSPHPVVRTSPPALGDAATLVELAPDDADAVVSALVGVLLDDGYEVRRTKGQRVQLRRGADRVVLDVSASA
jgi:hypothetical protein